jgi:hypothetical protein
MKQERSQTKAGSSRHMRRQVLGQCERPERAAWPVFSGAAGRLDGLGCTKNGRLIAGRPHVLFSVPGNFKPVFTSGRA